MNHFDITISCQYSSFLRSVCTIFPTLSSVDAKAEKESKASKIFKEAKSGKSYDKASYSMPESSAKSSKASYSMPDAIMSVSPKSSKGHSMPELEYSMKSSKSEKESLN